MNIQWKRKKINKWKYVPFGQTNHEDFKKNVQVFIKCQIRFYLECIRWAPFDLRSFFGEEADVWSTQCSVFCVHKPHIRLSVSHLSFSLHTERSNLRLAPHLRGRTHISFSLFLIWLAVSVWFCWPSEDFVHVCDERRSRYLSFKCIRLMFLY